MRSPPLIRRSTGSAASRDARSISSAIRSATRSLALRDQPYSALSEDGIFRVLVTGGSQGATILSDVVPDGLGLLPEHFRRRLQVTQQCRAEDIEEVRAQICAARHPRRSRHLHRRHAGQARLVASDHRPRGRLDHRRADRRRPARYPHPAAVRDRRSPDRQRARNGQGRAARGRSRNPPSPRSSSPSRCRSSASIPRRSPMPPRGRGPSAAPMPRRDLADLVERIGRDPADETATAEEAILKPLPNDRAYA